MSISEDFTYSAYTPSQKREASFYSITKPDLFQEPAKVFLFKKGIRYPDGRKIQNASWQPAFYGDIKIEFNHIIGITTKAENILQNTEVFSHEIKSNLELKSTKNCNRSWLYTVRDRKDRKERTFALRFETAEAAKRFRFDVEGLKENKREVENLRKMKRLVSTK